MEDGVVEGEVGGDEGVDVSGLVGVRHLVQLRLEARGVLVGAARGGELGGADLDDAAGLDQALGQRPAGFGLAVHGRADERLERGPLVDGVDVGAAAALHAHDVLRAQCLDRLADGEAAHPCLARQLALRRQRAVGRIAAVDDPGQKLVGELIRERGAHHQYPGQTSDESLTGIACRGRH